MPVHKKNVLFYTIGTKSMPSSRARIYIYEKTLEKAGIRFRIYPAINDYLTRMRIMGAPAVSPCGFSFLPMPPPVSWAFCFCPFSMIQSTYRRYCFP
jgi:hypothetical protein